MHGKGLYLYKSGNKYEGAWQDDKQHGQGTYTFINGNRYEGTWQNDNREGEGPLPMKMVINIQVNGKMIIERVRVNTPTATVINTRGCF